MEIWKNVVGFEGYHQVSNMGRIRSVTRIVRAKNNSERMITGKIMKQKKCKTGYMSVMLFPVRKHFLVHRLVMISFLGESRKQVDHINMIKQDNRLENLRYCSNKENSLGGNYNEACHTR